MLTLPFSHALLHGKAKEAYCGHPRPQVSTHYWYIIPIILVIFV